MSKKKKWILAILIPALVVGAVFGTYQILRANRDPVKVYPVKDLVEEGYNDYENYLSGTVRAERLQCFYPSTTQEITEVLVSVGDRVQKGDVLIRFNTTLSQLELERKAIDIQKAQDELEKAQRSYRRYFKQDYVIPPVSAGQNQAQGLAARAGQGFRAVQLSVIRWSDAAPSEPVIETTELVTEPTEPITEPTEPVTEPTEPVTEPTEPEPPVTEPIDPTEPVVDGVVVTLYQVGGTGTPEDPALYIMSSEYALTPQVLKALLGNEESLELVIAGTEEDRVEGVVCSAFGLSLTRDETGEMAFRFWNADAYLGLPLAPLQPEEPEPEPDPEPFPIGPVGPTWQELQQIRKDLEQRIRDLDLQIRMDQIRYRSMEAELGDGTVRAEYDGVILTLNDPEYSLETGEPMLKLSGGGGGYKIVCPVSELQVEKISLGQTGMVSTWNGGPYPAVVTEISPDPMSSDEYGYGYGGGNASYYPVTFEVDASADLGETDWADVMLDGGGKPQPDGYYLIKAFVLTENGKSFVMVKGQDGLLEKRFITTGRDQYGYSVEILGGLTANDFIAFPYAKAAQEGAKTVEGDAAELYGGGKYY